MNYDYPSILFVAPIQNDESQVSYEHTLGVGYIRAYLHQRGIESFQYLSKGNCTQTHLINDILEIKPDYLCLSCLNTTYHITKSIIRNIKKRLPDIKIVVGGPAATLSASTLLKDCIEIDYCVRGYGEKTFFRLITCVRNIKDTPGLAYRDGNNITCGDIYIDPAHAKDELDEYPSPYLSGIIPHNQNIGVCMSRGCRFSCIYCAFSANNNHELRHHSALRVFEEILHISSHNTTPLIPIWDDDVSCSPSHAKQLFRLLIENGVKATYSCNSRVDTIDNELIELMSSAGVKSINFGLETARPDTLQYIHKIPLTGTPAQDNKKANEFLEKIVSFTSYARSLGISVTLSTIMGLPGDRVEDYEDVIRLFKLSGANYLYSTHLRLFLNTPIVNCCNSREIIKVKKKWLGNLTTNTNAFSDLEKILVSPIDHNILADWFEHEDYSRYEGRSEITVNPLSTRLFGELVGYNDANMSPIFILDGHQCIDETIAYILAENCEYQSKVIIIDNAFDECVYLSNVDMIAKKNLPIQSIFYLVKDYNSIKSYSVSSRNKKKAQMTRIPLSKLTSYNEVSNTHECLVLLQIQDRTDAALFLDQINCMGKSGLMEIILHNRLTHGLLENSCMFGIFECSQVCRRRVFINKRSSLIPCKNVGHLLPDTVNMSDYNNFCSEIFAKTTAARKCSSCKVKSKCPKCINPFPFEIDEYCYLMRNGNLANRYVQALIDAIKIKSRRKYTELTVFSLTYDTNSGKYLIKGKRSS